MRVPLLLYALALVVRLVLIAVFPDPAYPDSYYYVNLARGIASGNGFEVDFVWILAEVGGRIPSDPVLPIPSNAYWLPLASLVQVPFIVLLGPTALASALPAALIGSLAAPITWLIARDLRVSPTVAVAAGALSAIPAAGTVFMTQPENFALVMPLTAAALWLAARGLRGDPRAFVASGFLVGLASIARNDAPLIGAAIGLLFFVERWRAWRADRTPMLPWLAAWGCLAAFLLVVGPWWLRQLAVFGSISPVASIALWLTDPPDWNSITAPSSFETFLAQGWESLLASRVHGLTTALSQFAVFIGSIVLVPFGLVGMWHLRRSSSMWPWMVYAALLVVVLSIAFPLQIPNGTFIHSAVGLSPHFYVAAVMGVAVLMRRIADRRDGWDAKRTTAVVSTGVVALIGASAIVLGQPVLAGWSEEHDRRAALGAEVDRLGVRQDDRILSIDSAGIRYHTGRPGVTTPNDSLETIELVARAYDTRWLVIERDAVVPALAPILSGGRRPDWIGPLSYAVRSDADMVDLALHPVCLDGTDERCSIGAMP